MSVSISINGNEIQTDEGKTILQAADSAEIYIPRLCHHPSLGSSQGLEPVERIHWDDREFENDGSGPDSFDGCRLCLVEIDGKDGLFIACDTMIEDGMKISSESDRVIVERKENLTRILKDHPHACLGCAQQEGCSRTQCSTNVPEDERCCPQLGHCEVQKVAQYVGIREDLTKYVFQDLPKHINEPLFDRDHNLCISCLRCVRACRDLRGIETLGFVYSEEKAFVGPVKSSMYSESDCRFCGACVEVCPTGALTDRDLPMGEREDVLVPCRTECPAGIDVPGYLDLIHSGDYQKAFDVITARVPFPGILGRVCFHPCEDSCRRSQINQPLGICGLKWFASDMKGPLRTKPGKSTKKKVAVVGGGPAGLSAAFFLAVCGHKVTVLESEEKVGGMLRYAIPDYRLPPDVIDLEMSVFEDLKVKFKTGTELGRDVSIADLRSEFDAVFLGLGACSSKKISLDGSELDGVSWGLDMLRGVKKGEISSIEGRVVVIGGGNVAIDVARTALRLGAENVILACLESADEMPAHTWEIEEAIEEGIEIHTSWGPVRILGGPSASGIELVKCTSVFDGQGRFAPQFDKSENRTFEAENIILAIGQSPDLDCLEGSGIDIKGGVCTSGSETTCTGVFAGGECARGPSSVVEAIADGAVGASQIDLFLGGDGDVYSPISIDHSPDPYVGRVRDFASMTRFEIPKRAVEVRKTNFNSIELGYEISEAVSEAGRCLRCDLRLLIEPVVLPPDKWMELTVENLETVPPGEGVIQLLDEEKNIIVIQGTQDMRGDLMAKLDCETKAKYFGFEPDPMYSKRESELIQQFLQQFGRMPEGDGEGDDLDDLF